MGAKAWFVDGSLHLRLREVELPAACPECEADLTLTDSIRVRMIRDCLGRARIKGDALVVDSTDFDYEGEDPSYLMAICNECGSSITPVDDFRVSTSEPIHYRVHQEDFAVCGAGEPANMSDCEEDATCPNCVAINRDARRKA